MGRLLSKTDYDFASETSITSNLANKSARVAVFSQPIYVAKAIPKGGRWGRLTADASKGRALADRLGRHATSIEQATKLEIADFLVRYLVVDELWIPLGENILFETFKPLWNRAIDGFGDPGRRRATQFRLPWDVLHPGRAFAEKLTESPMTTKFHSALRTISPDGPWRDCPR